MRFEYAQHINDYRAAVEAEGNDFFKFYEKDGYTVGNYISIMAKFPNPFEQGITDDVRRNRVLLRDMRGILFGPDGTVISKPLHKFHNLNEGTENQHDSLDWSSFEVFDKLDGCADFFTMLETPTGSMSIGEICETQYSGAVRGYDHETQTNVWVCVEATKVSENIDNWYEITIESGDSVILTGNHKVWCVNKNAYVRVDELNENDDVLINS